MIQKQNTIKNPKVLHPIFYHSSAYVDIMYPQLCSNLVD